MPVGREGWPIKQLEEYRNRGSRRNVGCRTCPACIGTRRLPDVRSAAVDTVFERVAHQIHNNIRDTRIDVARSPQGDRRTGRESVGEDAARQMTGTPFSFARPGEIETANRVGVDEGGNNATVWRGGGSCEGETEKVTGGRR